MVLPAHTAVFREGDPAGRVFTLIEGFAKLTRLLPDGKQQVVGFRFAGDVIGYTTLKTYPFDAEVLTDARLCRLDRPWTAAARHPQLERRMLDLCVQELTATQEQLVTVGRRSAEAGRRLPHLPGRCQPPPRPAPPGARDADDPGGHRRFPRPHARDRQPQPDRLPQARLDFGEPVHHRVELVDLPAITAMAEGTSD